MTVMYWHGGMWGLQVGERLLPAARHPIADEVHYWLRRDLYEADGSPVGGIPSIHAGSPRFHYVTTDIDLARLYAEAVFNARGLGNGGALYRVRPSAKMGVDASVPGGISFGCDFSVIEEVVEEHVHMHGAEYEELKDRLYPNIKAAEAAAAVPGAFNRSPDDFFNSL